MPAKMGAEALVPSTGMNEALCATHRLWPTADLPPVSTQRRTRQPRAGVHVGICAALAVPHGGRREVCRAVKVREHGGILVGRTRGNVAETAA
jgi:hypothetical protein